MQHHFPHECANCHWDSNFEAASLTQLQKNILLRHLDQREFLKGEVLFSLGDAASGIFLLCRGRVKIFGANREGRQQIIRVVKPGELFGSTAFRKDSRYIFSAEAMSSCRVSFLKTQDMLLLLDAYPHFSFQLISMLVSDMERMKNQVFSFGCRSARQRLAALLLDLCAQSEGESDGEVLISDEVTRKEIAEIIGTAPETAIRLLSAFGREGLIERRGRNILVPDCSRLKEVVEQSS